MTRPAASLLAVLGDLRRYIDAWRGTAHCAACTWTGPIDNYSDHWHDEHVLEDLHTRRPR
jgi:hypothetical protein